MVLTQMLELVRRCGSDATKCCKLQPVHGGSGVEIGAARVSAVAVFFLACPDCFALLAAFHSVRREADVFRAIAFL